MHFSSEGRDPEHYGLKVSEGVRMGTTHSHQAFMAEADLPFQNSARQKLKKINKFHHEVNFIRQACKWARRTSAGRLPCQTAGLLMQKT